MLLPNASCMFILLGIASCQLHLMLPAYRAAVTTEKTYSVFSFRVSAEK